MTWPGHAFMGPGNRVVDDKGNANFKNLPDNCVDWAALQHDVDYHNASVSGKTDVSEVLRVDNAAIDNVEQQCSAVEPFSSLVLKAGLRAKEHIENIADAAAQPFTEHKALYPRPTTSSDVKHIDWFDKSKSRRRLDPGNEPEQGQPDNHLEAANHVETAYSEADSAEYHVPSDWNGDEDPDLIWTDGNGRNPNVPSAHFDSMSVSSSNAGPSTSGGQPPAKKFKTSLPGTGSEDANDPDTGNPGIENAVIPRPKSLSTGHKFFFGKHHTFVLYGVATLQLGYGANTFERLGTTSLMSLPVDKPFFYLSPSEYCSIVSKISGVRINEVRVKAVMRNPRTAFETNASTSNLATLNQNKFIHYANGLRNKSRGLDMVYTFGTATSPMKPTSCAADDT